MRGRYASYWNAILLLILLHFSLLHHFSILASHGHTGWPHSSENEIPCVFPEFSLCYINFPCIIFMQKLTISSMKKGHIVTALLYTEAYKIIF